MNKDLNKINKNNNRVYLDFASETPASQKVLKAMKSVASFNFNPANLYKEGLEAENILHEARMKIARVLGVRDHEIYFSSNATLSCAESILGTFYFFKIQNKNNNLKPHIVTSNIEHAAVLENIKFLESLGEVEATYIECDEFGFIDPNKVKNAIKENTILISIMYVNNEIGTIQDIKNIAKKIKEYKKEKKEITENNYPYFHTDASQAGNYLSLYIDRLGVDMLSLNGSKIYGLKGSGILFKKEAIKISPFYFGGAQERNIFSGTQDTERAFGLAVAIEEAQEKLNNKKLFEEIARKRNMLAEKILKEIEEVKINGYFSQNEWKEEKIGILREERETKRLPSNLSIWLPDFPSDEMVLRLDKRGFSVSAGSACSAKSDEYSHVIYNIYKNKLKKKEAEKAAKETIRITIDKDTKEEDLKRFVKVLKEIYYKFKK